MIFISDLDQTLLNDKGELSSYSKNELNNLLEQGLNFTIATVRSFSTIEQILKGVKITLPIVEFNGAYISDFNTGEHFIINSIEKDIVPFIIEEVRKRSFEPFLSTYNTIEDKLYYETTINEGMDYYVRNRIQHKDKRLEKVQKLLSKTSECTICITVIGKENSLVNLKNELKLKFNEHLELVLMENQYSPGWYWLTIYNINSTKDKAIKKVLEMTNNEEKELYVFGDNYIDISMFKLTENSVAVSNAIPELKEMAKYIINSNNDDSVVKFIKEKYLTLNQ